MKNTREETHHFVYVNTVLSAEAHHHRRWFPYQRKSVNVGNPISHFLKKCNSARGSIAFVFRKDIPQTGVETFNTNVVKKKNPILGAFHLVFLFGCFLFCVQNYIDFSVKKHVEFQKGSLIYCFEYEVLNKSDLNGFHDAFDRVLVTVLAHGDLFHRGGERGYHGLTFNISISL